jgi:hypothetical protein
MFFMFWFLLCNGFSPFVSTKKIVVIFFLEKGIGIFYSLPLSTLLIMLQALVTQQKARDVYLTLGLEELKQ